MDDKEATTELYNLLQKQSFNQVEVDLFELLCKVLDHNLFAQVDWARNSYYFKELKVGPLTVSDKQIFYYLIPTKDPFFSSVVVRVTNFVSLQSLF